MLIRRRAIRPISLIIVMMVQEMLRIQEIEIEMVEMEEIPEMEEMAEMLEIVEMAEMVEMGETVVDRDTWIVSVTGMAPITAAEMDPNLRAACNTNNTGLIPVPMVDKVC